MSRHGQRRAESGFTIIELLVASTIFSIVVLVALSGFVEVGRLFYRGSIYTANQQTARNVLDHVSGDINDAGGVSKANTSSDGKKAYYCVGNIRYSFMLSQKVDLSNHDRLNHFGLLRDKPDGPAGCTNPFDGESPGIKADAAELLGNRMRLNYFCISRNNTVKYGNLYTVSINVVTGDDKYLSFRTNPAGGVACQAETLAACEGNLKNSQFCAANNLSSSVAAASSAVLQGPEVDTSPTEYSLSISKQGVGTGTISVDGSVCQDEDGGCSRTYPKQNPPVYVFVQVTPDFGFQFNGWSGSPVCGNMVNPCTLKMDGSVNLVANLARKK